MSSTDPFSFTKMQGAGNDFIIHDLRLSKWTIDKIIDRTPELCDRRYGIGADGVIALAESDMADYQMIYRNADGSDAGMCGNGGRCIALYAVSKGFTPKHQFEIHEQTYEASVKENYATLDFPGETQVEKLPDPLEGYQVYPGTEHIVLPVEESILKDLEYLRSKGKELRYHSFFQPVGTNVNFMHGINDQSIDLQTYERGVENLTLACGTGAIASAIVRHKVQSENMGDHNFTVYTEGGKLSVSFSYDETTGTYSNLKLGGPAHFVFEGTIQL